MMKLKVAVCVLGFVCISLLSEAGGIETKVKEAESVACADTSADRSEKRTKADRTARAYKGTSDYKTNEIKEDLKELLRDCISEASEEVIDAPAADYSAVSVARATKADIEEAGAEIEEKYYTIDESDTDDSTIAVVKVNKSVPLKDEPRNNARKLTSISRGETYKYIKTHIYGDNKWYEVDYWGNSAYLNSIACELENLSYDEYANESDYMEDLYGVEVSDEQLSEIYNDTLAAKLKASGYDVDNYGTGYFEVIVDADDGYVNVRKGCGVEYEIVTEIPNGYQFYIGHCYINENGALWASIEEPEFIGYIALSQVKQVR